MVLVVAHGALNRSILECGVGYSSQQLLAFPYDNCATTDSGMPGRKAVSGEYRDDESVNTENNCCNVPRYKLADC